MSSFTKLVKTSFFKRYALYLVPPMGLFIVYLMVQRFFFLFDYVIFCVILVFVDFFIFK